MTRCVRARTLEIAALEFASAAPADLESQHPRIPSKANGSFTCLRRSPACQRGNQCRNADIGRDTDSAPCVNVRRAKRANTCDFTRFRTRERCRSFWHVRCSHRISTYLSPTKGKPSVRMGRKAAGQHQHGADSRATEERASPRSRRGPLIQRRPRMSSRRVLSGPCRRQRSSRWRS